MRSLPTPRAGGKDGTAFDPGHVADLLRRLGFRAPPDPIEAHNVAHCQASADGLDLTAFDDSDAGGDAGSDGAA